MSSDAKKVVAAGYDDIAESYLSWTSNSSLRRQVWTAAEESRLRRLYPKADRHDVLMAFPERSWQQISAKARHIGLRRARRKLKATGHPLIDTIRERAFDLRLSMVDLDAMARTKRYFQNASWCTGRLDRKALLRAVEALGGQISVRWD